MDTEYTIDVSYIRESLEHDTMEFNSKRLSEITRMLGEAIGCMKDLFALRAKRCTDVTSYTTSLLNPLISTCGGNAEYGHNRDRESLKQMNVGNLTDKEGIPVAFDLFQE